MPPVLNVPLDKLVPGGGQQVLADQQRLGIEKRKRVLKLIAKAERSSRLVEGCSSPNTAAEGLVDQPAVHQEVEPGIWSLNLDCAQQAFPPCLGRRQRLVDVQRIAVLLDQGASLLHVVCLTEQENDLGFLARVQFDFCLQRCTRVKPGPFSISQPFAPHCGRIGHGTIPAEERTRDRPKSCSAEGLKAAKATFCPYSG